MKLFKTACIAAMAMAAAFASSAEAAPKTRASECVFVANGMGIDLTKISGINMPEGMHAISFSIEDSTDRMYMVFQTKERVSLMYAALAVKVNACVEFEQEQKDSKQNKSNNRNPNL